MNRRTLREKTIQALFQIDMTGVHPEKAVKNVMDAGEDDEPWSEKDRAFLHEMTAGTVEKQEEVDRVVSRYLKGWTLSRLSYVDRAILRLGAYELLYRDDIPGKVSVNEAIEMVKTFSTDESKQYINGVLSNIFHESGKGGDERDEHGKQTSTD